MINGERNYLEAVPRLADHKAARALLADRMVCRFSDQHGDDAGWVQVQGWSETFINMRWRFPALFRDTIGEGYIDFHYERAPHGRQAMFRCPMCRSAVRILAYRGGWGCRGRKCLNLRNRATLLTTEVRRAERDRNRLSFLRPIVEPGRPPGMHHSTFERLRKEYDVLRESERKYRPVQANRTRMRIITETWTSLQEAQHAYGFDEQEVFLL